MRSKAVEGAATYSGIFRHQVSTGNPGDEEGVVLQRCGVEDVSLLSGQADKDGF
jgi:hypothetical protein